MGSANVCLLCKCNTCVAFIRCRRCDVDGSPLKKYGDCFTKECKAYHGRDFKCEKLGVNENMNLLKPVKMS